MKGFMKYIIKRITGYGTYVNIKKVKADVDAIVSEKGSILNEMGFVQGTDKSSLMVRNDNMYLTHDYLRHYDLMFSSFRANSFTLLEFGCARGASLRTWEQYFPNAEIYGVDLDENAKRHETDRIHIVIGDATSKETFEALKESIGNAFIILDDASHAWSDQRRSFELFWDMLSPGGFYVIEDLMCGSVGAYPKFPPKILDSQPFFQYMKDRCDVLMWSPAKAYSYDEVKEEDSPHFKQLPPQVQKIEREMDMCTFIPGAVIVRKKA